MPTTVELPDDLRQRLRSCAQAANQSEEQIIRDALEAYLAVPWTSREELQAWQAAGAEAIEIVAPIANEAWLGVPSC
jgi:predicted transcriptional regulator